MLHIKEELYGFKGFMGLGCIGVCVYKTHIEKGARGLISICLVLGLGFISFINSFILYRRGSSLILCRAWGFKPGFRVYLL